MLRIILFVMISILFLQGCVSTNSSLQEGKNYLEEKDYVSAFSTLVPLAEKDNADAQYAVGYLYYYGKGTEKNKELALSWIRKAAAQGQPEAVKALDLIHGERIAAKTTASGKL